MKITVRRAVAADHLRLAVLLAEMQEHYGSPNPPGGAEACAHLLTRPGERLPFALVAERNAEPLGLATLNPVLFGGAFQWMLFLKDLYVTRPARSLGVGRTLLAAAARIALDEGYCRIDWTTDATNTGAQRLYDGLGIPRHDKPFYRLANEALERMARG